MNLETTVLTLVSVLCGISPFCLAGIITTFIMFKGATMIVKILRAIDRLP